MRRAFSFLAVVIVLSLAVLSCQTTVSLPPEAANTPSAPSPTPTAVAAAVSSELATAVVPPALDLVSTQDALVRLYEQVSPGVVMIRVMTSRNEESLGSGFVVDMEGNIVTNYHVIQNLTQVEVAFASGYKTRATVVGADLDSDLAVIRVDVPEEQLHPLTFGDSDQVKVGQVVVAIGNPFGYESTMTLGIVSGLGRTVTSMHQVLGSSFSIPDVIQTDASINPGNSGGPLLNLDGEVIGVNESIVAQGRILANSGVGFAISANVVQRVYPSLVAIGRYDYPYLGIESLPDGDMTVTTQEALGLDQANGVYVTRVVSGGPAEQAGLQGGTVESSIPGLRSGGDLIIGVDGQVVDSYDDLISYIIKHRQPGDTITLTVLRSGQELQVDLVLGKRPPPS